MACSWQATKCDTQASARNKLGEEVARKRLAEEDAQDGRERERKSKRAGGVSSEEEEEGNFVLNRISNSNLQGGH